MAEGKNYPVLALVAIGVLVLSGILEIVAIACPYWHLTDAVSAGRSLRLGHYGLWVVCFTYVEGIATCTSEYLNTSGWLGAVRAMNILGMMCGTGALVMMGLYAFVFKEKWTHIFKISAIVSGIVAGLLILIGAVIYGASVSNGKSVTTVPIVITGGARFSYQLSWAFGLSITAAILIVVSSVLVGFAQKVRM